MAQAEIRETLNVDKDKLYQVVVRYEDYPQFVTGCRSVQVERSGPGRCRVAYRVSMIKEVAYTVEQREDPGSGLVEWNLVESDFLKRNSGRWQLQAAGPGRTNVYYAVEVEFKIPVPSLILNRLIKGSLPEMIRSFYERAQAIP